MNKNAIGILKVLSSGELLMKLDKNGDGKIQWSEVKNAPISVWFEIGVKYIPLILSLLV